VRTIPDEQGFIQAITVNFADRKLSHISDCDYAWNGNNWLKNTGRVAE